MDSLKGMELSKLKAICRSVLADDEEEQSESESKEETKSESKSDDENGWTPVGPGTTQYVFNIGASAAWSPSEGKSNREKEIARRKKEQSDA